jgi:hypothetical protein
MAAALVPSMDPRWLLMDISVSGFCTSKKRKRTELEKWPVQSLKRLNDETSHISGVNFSKFVVIMKCPPMTDPCPQRFFFLVLAWHHAMAILSVKLDKHFMFHIPLLFKFRHGSQKALKETNE